MDPIDRIDHKKFPPATIYDLEFQWPKTHPDNPRKQIATKRNTYMDQIFSPKNMNAVPGVGKYDMLPTEQQVETMKQNLRIRKFTFGQRDNPFSQIENLSSRVPGCGSYNPHDHIIKTKTPS